MARGWLNKLDDTEVAARLLVPKDKVPGNARDLVLFSNGMAA